MRRRVAWSNRGRDAYLSLLRYIADENPTAAQRVATRIDRTLSALSDLPTGRPGRVASTYEKPVRNLPYIVAYEIVVEPDESETIVILHIVYCARDWPSGRWPA